VTGTGRRAPEIYLVGLGIQGVRHLTREAEDCLAACRDVFLLHPTFGVAEFVGALGPAVHDLLAEYVADEDRVLAYRRMATHVVSAALERPPTALATYGHPLVLTYPSTLVQRGAAELGLQVYVVPGISSLDTVLVDLGIDPGTTGMAIHEASSVVLERKHLDDTIATLVLQLSAFGSAYHTPSASRPSRFAPFRDHLLEYFPATHVVTDVQSATFPILPRVLTPFALGDLAEVYANEQLGGTLFIPPARAPELDEDVLRIMHDPLAIGRLTYPPG
jgi:precorrin-6B methylase 1